MNSSNSITCKICTLPSSVPSSRIDETGICIYCRDFKGKEELERKRREYEGRFQELINQYKSQKSGANNYDILAAYSGGKDSSFTLDLLKNRYHLRVLAITFDHGFVSPYAFQNIKKVTEALGIDHLTFKPNFNVIKKVFKYSIENEFHPPKALERASSLCNSCMGLVKFVTLKIAIEKDVPFIAYGWSPGQAPLQSAITKNHPSFIKKAQDLFLRPLLKAVGPELQSYFLDESYLLEKEENHFPYNINPLAFLRYDEKEIYSRIHELGWRPPKDTDPNSTNCLLNAFANQVHIEKYHYNPYAMEMAELVREGILTKEEALRRTHEPMDSSIIEKVKTRLGIESG